MAHELAKGPVWAPDAANISFTCRFSAADGVKSLIGLFLVATLETSTAQEAETTDSLTVDSLRGGSGAILRQEPCVGAYIL